jgi:hypothetical protein
MADPISTIKGISEIVKKYNDIDLMKKVVDLQSEVFDLQSENRSLREQLDTRVTMRMSGEHGYFYQDGDPVPFCPKCWESGGKAIHLPNAKDFGSYHGRICRVCKHAYEEGPRQNPSIQTHVRGDGPWS